MTMPYNGDGALANPSQFAASGGGGGGGVSSVTAADTSIVIGGTGANPTVRTGTLDVIAADHPPATAWSNNSKRITNVANGSGAQDAAAFGQIPLADTTAAHILALGAQAAGSNGLWADSGHVHPTTGVALLAGATFTGYVAPAVVTLTFVGGGTTTINAASGNSFILTLTASTTTLGVPSNAVDGEVIRLRVIQGGAGSFTMSFSSASGGYDFGTAGAPTLSTAAGKVDILGFEYVASLSKWCYLGSGLGF